MPDIGYFGALIAGILSFISPCVLPIVPPTLAYIAGVSFGEMTGEKVSFAIARKVFFSTLAFVLGFSTIFIALGATASVIGQWLNYYRDTMLIIAGIIIIIMGLHFIGVFKIGFLYREARIQIKNKPVGTIGSYILGLAFGFGWTPCIGPALGSIMLIAANSDSPAYGASLLAVYSLGIGVPFLIAAAFIGAFMSWANKFKKNMRAVEIVMGVFLVITGLVFAFNKVNYVSEWFIETFPVLMQYA